ncbi:MAG: hypothetical protein HYZ28_06510 [Myxococcales bacterium]|nr:hypothetical protein [Myxococcales bacterium]
MGRKKRTKEAAKGGPPPPSLGPSGGNAEPAGDAVRPEPGGPAVQPEPIEGERRQAPEPAAVAAMPASPLWAAARAWTAATKVELVLFAVSYALLASFSSQRFLRQSEAPHFVYQAKAWLDGRLDLDPDGLPERTELKPPLPTVIGRMPFFEDWACVRLVDGKKVRCEGPVRAGDRFYSSFPAFPSVVMLPFVAIHGYQLNDTSFGVLVGALAVALFYSLLRRMTSLGESQRGQAENAALALLLGFGTLFFYCAIRGEVWFSAEVMGVALTCLYVRCSIGGRQPILAGLFFSMAVLTRTPLLFAGVFFLVEAVCPGPNRLEQLRKLGEGFRPVLKKLGLFAAGAAPLGLLAAVYNQVRFGSFTEFGHRFIYFNRVNADIDRFGLFDFAYLKRNIEAAFLKLPDVSLNPPRLGYDPHGMSLLVTLPLIPFLFFPREKQRLSWPLWLAVAACAVPGLFYQNTGYMQFGFRFSLDYTPYLLLLFAVGGSSLKSRWVMAAAALAVAVNFWGAAAFRGYTEMVRGW